ncbi:hypothetical protein [Streptomyces purpureus]|uniref:ABM domain-containing protein n=1 Tax=Streptomyces purpureus TaxID=1951 RepID=A0A918LV45_9ACTN|nr:hypothetical protein [Streptomyces purpureus]GGT53988.1 hypothetical protein GCM10014713_54840 [Streptomyces purpureus]
MAVGMLIDNPEGSQEQYDALQKQLDLSTMPQGLIYHCAGPSPDGGWRVVDIWESEADAQRFFAETLLPAREAAGLPDLSGEPVFWPIYHALP